MSPLPGIDRIDEVVGDRLERAVRRHHRRRLTALGHGAAFDPPDDGPWVPGVPAPRDGNALDVLVDGDQALRALHDALLTARSHVHLAGWHLAPGFRLHRGDDAPTVADLLRALAERIDVRVLLWAGPPVPVFQPTRGSVRRIRDELTAGGNVRCVLDARERTLHCHHEKIVVVDDEVAFVGGIDLTDLSGDRWDEREHPPRGAIGWHDTATRLRGPIVADVARHFRDRWQEVAGEPLPEPVPPPPAGEVTAQFLRTVPERTYDFAPTGEFRILDAYLRALRSAERLIYLENQFLWSAEVIDVLRDKLAHPPHPDFRMVLLLPARPGPVPAPTRPADSSAVWSRPTATATVCSRSP